MNNLSMVEKKKDAYDESDRAVQLNPKNALALRARAQAQAAMGLIGESISSLERAYAIEPRADVALDYGRALLSRSTGTDYGTDSRRPSSAQSSPTCTPRSPSGPTECCVCI